MLRGHPDLDLVLVMKIDDLKIALDDVRARQTALVNLIIFTDQKAMAVFRLYVTLGIAAGAAGAASFFRNDALLEFARWAMVATACWLALGALFCFRAMSRASINLPGRGPGRITRSAESESRTEREDGRRSGYRSQNGYSNTPDHRSSRSSRPATILLVVLLLGVLALATIPVPRRRNLLATIGSFLFVVVLIVVHSALHQ
ncbi:hypothetical protein [Rhizobium leguminosarum]|uniref:hypothetical protein n=1 Tax=Rhizobium leguminosarum TaxID=384 RepID=UPI00197F57ED|nr:hypothetical protein [Rhizobium leguminosarum]NKM99455.1 hypothetical protein [Rhizobium leguminosarum bv. viciae]